MPLRPVRCTYVSLSNARSVHVDPPRSDTSVATHLSLHVIWTDIAAAAIDVIYHG
jgi:hypothetical protein